MTRINILIVERGVSDNGRGGRTMLPRRFVSALSVTSVQNVTMGKKFFLTNCYFELNVSIGNVVS